MNRLVQSALACGWQLTVVELEGHGLSEGPRAVCADFERLVRHVTEAIPVALEAAPKAWALSGNSLGATVAAYASERLTEAQALTFCGSVLFAPAVGVDERVVPSAPLVMGLRFLAAIMPDQGLFLTPYEDPS